MKISIITVAYNSAPTLRDTMESVLTQTHSDWEHIIVDGASTDGTPTLLHDMEPRYGGRLRWISEPDRGLYDAMNKGLRMATGQVVGLLNSDDFYTSRHVLERVADALTAHDVDAVYGDIHFVEPDDLDTCVRYYSSRSFARWMMLMGYQPAHPSFYCAREVYNRLGGFDLRFDVASDFEHLLRLIYVNSIRTRYLPMDFVTMRLGGASTSGASSHLHIIRDHFRAYTKHRIPLGYLTDFLRYPMKIGELMFSKFIQ